jgi:hypothetical protein
MRTVRHTLIDDEVAKCEIEFALGCALLHATFRKRFAAMRNAREILATIKATLRKRGYEWVYVIINDKVEGTPMRYRFMQHMGFKEFVRLNTHNIMMRQET